MKRTTLIVLLTMLFLGIPSVAAFAQTSVAAGVHIGPSGRTSVDIGFFYDDLAPYGYWVDRPSYGWSWAPRHVASSWRPYSDGHWALTDAGWTWISDEPFGWATYHYGRWVLDPDYGWLWIPGSEWAPAQVSWRESDDYIGWAPLPPPRVDLVAADYVFVPARSFLVADIGGVAVSYVDSARIFPRTRRIASYGFGARSYYDAGVPVARVQRLIGRSVPRYRLADLSPGFRHRGTRITGGRVALFRPQVARSRVAPPPARTVARRALMSPREAAAIRSSRGRAVASSRTMEVRRQERTARHPVMAQRTVQQRNTVVRGRSGRERSISSRRNEVRQHGRSARPTRSQTVRGHSPRPPERHVAASNGRSRHTMVRQRSTMVRGHGGHGRSVSRQTTRVTTHRSRGGRSSAVRQRSARPPQRVHVQRQRQMSRQMSRPRGGSQVHRQMSRPRGGSGGSRAHAGGGGGRGGRQHGRPPGRP
ncbi:MAG TPA: DUF6600 domain-containing protein [Thermoanaerobaculia bacterium]|nr:DUF6600 domain-containing protein [Thermoanaerobaculia bacterium]